MTDFNIPSAITAPDKRDDLAIELERNGFEADLADLLVESFRKKESDAKKLKAAEDRLAQDIERKIPLSRIEDCLLVYSWTEAELKQIGWYDNDGNLTVFGRICMFAVRGNTTISDRNRQLKAKKVDNPSPSASRFGSPSFDNNIDLHGLMESSDPSEAPFYTYHGPNADRADFLKRSERRGVEVREDDRFTPVEVSARPGYDQRMLTESMAAKYMGIGRRLDTAYRMEMGLSPYIHDPIDLVDFSAWFVTRGELTNWTKSTIVKYQKALTHWILTVYSECKLDDCPLLSANLYQAMDAVERDLGTQEREERLPSKNQKTRRAPAHVEKCFQRKDMEAVIAHLRHRSKDAYCETLENWLIAGVNTGLRPGEWRLTSVVEGEKPMTQEPYIILYVMNGKATNGRGNGVVRTLDITDMSSTVLNAIRRMSDIGFEAYQKGENAYANMHKRCSGLLTRACASALGKKGNKYCLYNCRHQFIANAKGLRRTPEEIACMIGCYDGMIAMGKYGRKAMAWDGRYLLNFPKPVEVELKLMLRYADAIAKQKVRYAGIVNGWTVGITPEMRADIEF